MDLIDAARSETGEIDFTGWIVLKTAAGDVIGKLVGEVQGRRTISPAWAYGFSLQQVGPNQVKPTYAVEPWQWLVGVTELVVDGPGILYRVDQLTGPEQQELRRLIAGAEARRMALRAQRSGVELATTIPHPQVNGLAGGRS